MERQAMTLAEARVQHDAESSEALVALRREQVRKGSLVYWEMVDFNTSKEVLTGLGLGEFLPRNDAKAALIEALKRVTRGNVKFYRRFADHGPHVRFVVVNPATVATVNAEGQQDLDVDFKKEITVNLEKSSGLLTLVAGEDHEFFETVKELYQQERHLIDSNQLRAVLVRFIREKAFGISLRSRGGIYFVDERKAQALAALKQVFARFHGTTKLHSFAMYNDEGAQVAVRDAAVEDLVADIDEAVRSLQAQVEAVQQEAVDRAAARVLDLPPNENPAPVRVRLATRTVRAKQEEAATLLAKIEFYRENLAGMGDKLAQRAQALRAVATELGQDIPANVTDLFGRI